MLIGWLSECGRRMQVGKLIGELNKTEIYIDPSIKNTWNIINAQRIIGVHIHEKVEIPSQDQVLMVIFGLKDILNRTFKT